MKDVKPVDVAVYPVVRDAYNYNRHLVSQATGVLCPEESLAVQSMRDEADINVIMKRFGVTGVLPVSVRVPEYTDYDEVFDFQTAQAAIIEANVAFMRLDASIRARFDNDPQGFLEFCSNAENIDEMVKLGLAVKKETESPVEPKA